MFWHRKHPDCKEHFPVEGEPVSCERCLLLFIIERLHQMPDSTALDAATAAVSAAIDAGFTSLEATVTTETAAIVAALQAAQASGSAVPQASIDAVTALGAKLQAGFAAASAAIAAELPSA